MNILVLNAGSSSLKFQLFSKNSLKAQASGLLEQIGDEQGQVSILTHDVEGKDKKIKQSRPLASHQEALTTMFALLRDLGSLAEMESLAAIGHRVTHGGEAFHGSVLIDEEVIATIASLSSLAPLHNPANLIGIRLARKLAPNIPQVAVFDTAFHQTIPAHAYIYGLPYALYEKHHVRRYGFHGTSHQYVARQAAHYLHQDITTLKLIALHLGNGASATAIHHGQSLDTSMGMTPLEGLLMGSRCGDLDPAIPLYLARELNMSCAELDDLLNKHSGLLGICGNNDMRAIIALAAAEDPLARLALTIFCYRLKKYIGAYLAALNGADAIIFTGGIGENSGIIRQQACANLHNLGIMVDPEKNNQRSGDIMEIQTATSQTKILVIPTNEELEIARQTVQLI